MNPIETEVLWNHPVVLWLCVRGQQVWWAQLHRLAGSLSEAAESLLSVPMKPPREVSYPASDLGDLCRQKPLLQKKCKGTNEFGFDPLVDP